MSKPFSWAMSARRAVVLKLFNAGAGHSDKQRYQLCTASKNYSRRMACRGSLRLLVKLRIRSRNPKMQRLEHRMDGTVRNDNSARFGFERLVSQSDFRHYKPFSRFLVTH